MAVPHTGSAVPAQPWMCPSAPSRARGSSRAHLLQPHPAPISQLFQHKRANTHRMEQEKPESAEQREPPAVGSSLDTHLGKKILQLSGKSCRYSE